MHRPNVKLERAPFSVLAFLKGHIKFMWLILGIFHTWC